jgi:hypothetical protein
MVYWTILMIGGGFEVGGVGNEFSLHVGRPMFKGLPVADGAQSGVAEYAERLARALRKRIV